MKDNIGAFNGDNKAVTLMGHTTGAACVNLLMLSPIARGIEGITTSGHILLMYPLTVDIQNTSKYIN